MSESASRLCLIVALQILFILVTIRQWTMS